MRAHMLDICFTFLNKYNFKILAHLAKTFYSTERIICLIKIKLKLNTIIK